jgi:hypothetical protein
LIKNSSKYGQKTMKICDRNPNPFLLEQIARAIDGVRFGSVEIVIQDGRVVQIERKEKFRLDRDQSGSLRSVAQAG